MEILEAKMRAFENWWNKYKMEGIWDYKEHYEAGWIAALEWVLEELDKEESYEEFNARIKEELK